MAREHRSSRTPLLKMQSPDGRTAKRYELHIDAVVCVAILTRLTFASVSRAHDVDWVPMHSAMLQYQSRSSVLGIL